MALDTVTDFCSEARILLQDTTNPVRYSDDELVSALQMGLMETRKLRPDLFLGTSPGELTVIDPTAVGNQLSRLDVQYRVPILYYMVGALLHAGRRRGEWQSSGGVPSTLHR
jgi:hypothetical protein